MSDGSKVPRILPKTNDTMDETGQEHVPTRNPCCTCQSPPPLPLTSANIALRFLKAENPYQSVLRSFLNPKSKDMGLQVRF